MNMLHHLMKGKKEKKKVNGSSSSSRSRSDMTSFLFQVIVSFIHYYLLCFSHIFCLQGTSLRGRQREALMKVLTAPEQVAPKQAPLEQPPPPPPLMTDDAMN
jgi:hypothetical protein